MAASVDCGSAARVIVQRGVYREWVRPERGGTGPDQMIWYEAAPGEDVQLKGSEVWSPRWQATDGAWRAALDPKLFPGENPFALTPGIPPVQELFDPKFVQPMDYQLGSEYAPVERLLQADVLGRQRPASRFDVGPLVGLPLNGSPIKVDPRRMGK